MKLRLTGLVAQVIRDVLTTSAVSLPTLDLVILAIKSGSPASTAQIGISRAAVSPSVNLRTGAGTERFEVKVGGAR